jgi:hypothetical protein
LILLFNACTSADSTGAVLAPVLPASACTTDGKKEPITKKDATAIIIFFIAVSLKKRKLFFYPSKVAHMMA